MAIIVDIDKQRRDFEVLQSKLSYIRYCCTQWCVGRESCSEQIIIMRELDEALTRLRSMMVSLGWQYGAGVWKDFIQKEVT